MVSMVSQYNALLDSRCACHIIRDRRLFCSYASAEKSMSVDTANCGSLEVLGIGDAEFRCPFRDRHVVFTMCGCLYAPEAPINLFSIGTLVEHGMSCLFSSGGLTKVFYPQNHATLPGFAFSVIVMNRLSFLKLVFLPPVDSVLPKYTPFEQPSSSGDSSHLIAGLTSNHNRLPTPSPRQHSDVVSNSSTAVAITNDAPEDVGLAFPLPAHGGVMITEVTEDQAAKLSALDLDSFQVSTHPTPSSTPLPFIPFTGIGFNRTSLEISKLDTSVDAALHGGADTLMDVDFGVVPMNRSGDNFVHRSSAPFYPCFSFLPSSLKFNDTTCFPYPPLYSCDNSSFRSSISQFPTTSILSSSFSMLTQYLHVVSSQVFSLSAPFLFQISSLRRPQYFSIISPIHFEVSSLPTVAVCLRALAHQLFSGVAVQIQPEPHFPPSQSLSLHSQFRTFVFLLSPLHFLGFSIDLVPRSRATTHGGDGTNLFVVSEEHCKGWLAWDLNGPINGRYSFWNDVPVIFNENVSAFLAILRHRSPVSLPFPAESSFSSHLLVRTAAGPPITIFSSTIISSHSVSLFPLPAMQGRPASAHPQITFDRIRFRFQCYSVLELVSSTPSTLFQNPVAVCPFRYSKLEDELLSIYRECAREPNIDNATCLLCGALRLWPVSMSTVLSLPKNVRSSVQLIYATPLRTLSDHDGFLLRTPSLVWFKASPFFIFVFHLFIHFLFSEIPSFFFFFPFIFLIQPFVSLCSIYFTFDFRTPSTFKFQISWGCIQVAFICSFSLFMGVP
jgi:hypothetical protein